MRMMSSSAGLPMNRPLNELDIHYYAKEMKIKNFRGCFMRDAMPKHPHKNECAIVNLDSESNHGTHWTAYIKKNNNVYYFDSFGDLSVTQELSEYFGDDINIYYNYHKYQNYGSVICGHLCLLFLKHNQ